ncbi:hypothetical protein AVEN_181144-1 [Araneus ventricosus]|uniref:Secreted protein n=1 Tax=Araneus ventricosus TaxID=182803 RepID=A0A4Y2KLV0_ARAVE|nr:hypothetical protein AVEN_181144-1 [Araneus ventricosus]
MATKPIQWTCFILVMTASTTIPQYRNNSKSGMLGSMITLGRASSRRLVQYATRVKNRITTGPRLLTEEPQKREKEIRNLNFNRL